jgi:predicted GIY-YIG superfamily endonuclease
MSKITIDYSNTIIYTISCINPDISELYVGHTTDFAQRKKAHKQNCINQHNTCKLYTFIRNNGGWDNWDMKIVKFYNCADLSEARQKEQEMYVLLKATLNSIEPFSKNKPISNENKQTQPSIRYICDNKPKDKFSCSHCDYYTSRNSQFKRHLLTDKHICRQLSAKSNNSVFSCKCGKIYKDRTGLWRHKKKCSKLEEDIDEDSENIISHKQTDKELIMMLIKENSEFKSMMMEVIKNGTNNTTNNGDNDFEKEEKIIAKISKGIIIDKTC